jgi:hypothetical protein
MLEFYVRKNLNSFFSIPNFAGILAQPSAVSAPLDTCTDERGDCVILASNGGCRNHADFMASVCRVTCGFCGTGSGVPPCYDRRSDCIRREGANGDAIFS